MKIGIYTDPCFYKIWGGVSRVTQELVSRLANIDDENEYVLFNACGVDDNSFFKINKPNFRAVAIPGQRKKLIAGWTFLNLPHVEKWTGKLDVMHAPCHLVPSSRAPLITTIHDLYIITEPSHMFSMNMKIGASVAFRRAVKGRLIACVSENTRREVIHYLKADEKKVVTIHNGVSDMFVSERGSPDEADQIMKKHKIRGRYIIYVSVIKPGKNQAGLLRAYENFRNSHPGEELDLVIAGKDGEYPEFYELLQKSKYKKNIHITGFVGNEDLPPLIRSSAGMVFPSFMEGFGLPIVEAMACGVPCAASDIPTIREVAGDVPLQFFNPHKDEEIEAAIEKIALGGKEIEESARLGLQRAKEFSWDRVAEKYLDLYKIAAKK